MATLASGLATHDTGGQGSDATYNNNAELLDEKLVNVLVTTTILGSEAITDETTVVTDPTASTATDPAIVTVSGTGDDSNINTNFSNLDTQINNLIADNASIRAQLIATIDYCDSLKAKVNGLITALENMGVVNA